VIGKGWRGTEEKEVKESLTFYSFTNWRALEVYE